MRLGWVVAAALAGAPGAGEGVGPLNVAGNRTAEVSPASTAGSPGPASAPASGPASQPAGTPLREYRLRKVTDLPAELSARIERAPWPDLPDLGPLLRYGTADVPASSRTMIKACWDDAGIRILWHCEDGQVQAKLRDRDAPAYTEDCVEVFICPTGDLTRYFELVFNPLGVAYDTRIHRPQRQPGVRRRLDVGWNCSGLRWTVAGRGRFNGTAETDAWWAIEASIPYEALGMDRPEPGERWRANVFRVEHGPRNEDQVWSPIPDGRYGFHRPDRFGTWIFED